MTSVRALAVAAVVVLVAAGCGDDDGDEAANTTTSTAAAVEAGTTTTGPTSTTAALDSEQAAIAAYNAYWAAFVAAQDPPDPDAPGLAALASGEALQVDRDLIAAQLDRGERVETDVTTQPVVEVFEPGAAVLTDCITGTTTVFAIASGEVVRAEPPYTAGFRTTLRFEDARWVVTLRLVEDSLCQS